MGEEGIMNFGDWKEEVVFYAKHEYQNLAGENPSASDFDWDAWGDYWKDGMTPREAIITDLQAG